VPARPQAAAYPVQAPGPAHRLALQPARKLLFPRSLGHGGAAVPGLSAGASAPGGQH